jgi:hypothetical protein
VVFPVLEKNSAKTKESGQAFVGLPRNVCLEHFPAKWMPVCVEKMRQNKEPELSSASMEVEKALRRGVAAATSPYGDLYETPSPRDFFRRCERSEAIHPRSQALTPTLSLGRGGLGRAFWLC